MHREAIREMMRKKVNLLNTYVPYNAEVEKMGYYRTPLNQCRPKSIGAMAFAKLWDEMKKRFLKEHDHGN